MEKRTPHYKLLLVKTMIKAGSVRSTASALTNGAALGFDFDGIINIIKTLTKKDFYKSMTTHVNHQV